MANHAKRIAEIQEILESGVEEVTVDGTTTKFNLDSLRAELRRLQGQDDSQRSKRPVASSIRLGGC